MSNVVLDANYRYYATEFDSQWRFTLQDEFEDDTAKSLAVCLNFCTIDDLLAPCILKDR